MNHAEQFKFLFKEELKNLFCETFAEILQTLEKFDKAEIDEAHLPRKRTADEKMVIFCAAPDILLLRSVFTALGWKDIYLCDNDLVKQNRWLHDLPIVKPSELAAMGNFRVAVSVSAYEPAVAKQLAEMGLGDRLLSPEEVAAGFLYQGGRMARPHLQDIDLIEEAFSLLHDDKSRTIFLNVIKSRLITPVRDQIFSRLAEGNQYYALPSFRPTERDIYLDAGAAHGDTIETFLYNCRGRFEKILAIEPARGACSLLSANCAFLADRFEFDRSNIHIFHAALGKTDDVSADEIQPIPIGKRAMPHMLPFTRPVYPVLLNPVKPGPATPAEIASRPVKNIAKLDTLMGNRPVTFIKADIEGFELDMLEGGRETIAEHRPRLAICLYHRYDDLWKAALFLKNLVPQYKFAIRHHSHTPGETVLYAWV